MTSTNYAVKLRTFGEMFRNEDLSHIMKLSSKQIKLSKKPKFTN